MELLSAGGVPLVASPSAEHSFANMQARVDSLPVSEHAQVGDCFHCGLPVPRVGGRTAMLNGAARSFCCPGCEAIALAIVGQGLGDYYRFRESLPARPADPADGEFAVYDEPAAQRGFVKCDPEGTREASLLLDGIRCSACVWLNEQTLARLPGVLSAEVNYATGRARVRWEESRIKLSRILAAVAAIGYRAYPFEPGRADALQRRESRSALWRLFVAGFGMMQVMMYAVPVYIADEGTMSADVEQLMRWASLLLTVPVVLYAAMPFFRGASRDLKAARVGMDVPVAIGVLAAFAASVWATVRGTGEVYFDSISMFVFLLLAGRYLELRARQRAGASLDYLMRLVPEVCSRLTGVSAAEIDRVPVATLAVGDRVLVRPGETIPADGVLEAGEGAVSESLLTGESRPVPKRAGDELIGGALNVGNPLVVRVLRVGPDTVLSGIVRLVERATAERQPIVETADRFAQWFVVAVLLLSAAAAVGWMLVEPSRALWVTVSVLVVTCPCALSLATPVALMAATGELARRGFVVTRGHTLEALARATDVVFDKTGTLTRGEMRVVRVESCAEVPASACIETAAALETLSEHPIAHAIVEYAGGRPRRTATAVTTTAGGGVEGVVDGARCRIGTAAFCGLTEPREDAVVLVQEGRLLARFWLDDALRPDARALIAMLKADGRTVHLLSGDAEGAVASAAGELGIEHWRPRCGPAGKQAYLRDLQGQGRVVAMVGDGVNDAPVLAQADVSVAMASGAHLAQARADAVLLSNRLGDLGEAVRISRKTLRIVRENLLWAALYNALVLPAAIAGFVTPWMAGIGMSGSSLAVVLNALRLREAAHTTPRAAMPQDVRTV